MAASDTFSAQSAGLDSPMSHAALVTPDDANDLAVVTRGISFGTAGALKIVTAGGETVVIPNGALAAGVIHRLRVTRIYATGTAAANIVAYY